MLKSFLAFLFTFLCPFAYANGHSSLDNKPSPALTISDYLGAAVQPPHFVVPPPPLTLSSEKLVEMLRPILRERLAETNYDRVHVVLHLLDHHKKHVEQSLLPFSFLKELKGEEFFKNARGAPCVGLTLDIFDHLPKNIHAYIVAAELPRRYHQFAAPQYCHTAVLIPFQTDSEAGFVVLDPSFDFAEPIVVKEGGAPYFYDMGNKGVWVFFLEKDKIICQISQSKTMTWTEEEIENKRMSYRTDALLNPIESSAVPMILIDRRLSLLARDENGIHLSHLNIELNKNRIIWDQHGVQFEPISFDDFLSGKFRFTESFAKGLYLTADELNQIVLRVLEEKPRLDQLYRDYLKLLHSSQDWSITGPLDKAELEHFINYCVR